MGQRATAAGGTGRALDSGPQDDCWAPQARRVRSAGEQGASFGEQPVRARDLCPQNRPVETLTPAPREVTLTGSWVAADAAAARPGDRVPRGRRHGEKATQSAETGAVSPHGRRPRDGQGGSPSVGLPEAWPPGTLTQGWEGTRAVCPGAAAPGGGRPRGEAGSPPSPYRLPGSHRSAPRDQPEAGRTGPQGHGGDTGTRDT